MIADTFRCTYYFQECKYDSLSVTTDKLTEGLVFTDPEPASNVVLVEIVGEASPSESDCPSGAKANCMWVHTSDLNTRFIDDLCV